MLDKKSHYSEIIKSKAKALGFLSCGISKVDFLEKEAPRLEQWLNQNHHGEMAYMANHFDKRLDPRVLVPGAKSVVSLLLNYHTEEKQTDVEAPKIASYAFGEDYHNVIKDKLKQLMNFIHQEIGEVAGRVFVDSAPVMDKAWAAKSGLGWIGKNTNLISKKAGSFFFIAELILDLELEHDLPATDHCGSCTACIDACPTDALLAPYQIDGSKCISYVTIELKNEIPTDFQGKMDNWAFGCDVCQTVCPWNRFATPHSEPAFNPPAELLSLSKNEWEEMTQEVFSVIFKNSAIKRTKYEGLKRNIKFLST
ncbi:MAG: tRNA epoxyqueuosine(34) reductase QueG [Salibacteraceae bacterium]|nr:tRNA epoxyqueuosine(34) reductase QueG [Salibacteraceae bacterium]